MAIPVIPLANQIHSTTVTVTALGPLRHWQAGTGTGSARPVQLELELAVHASVHWQWQLRACQ